ncbi:Zn(II)2Cys6 transcription factor [Aspergillus stella-maris]|uniref:Zn(II)2Cys6 transcription factor n=1 Tax=Aspergillus stella-maris TaxID=1810926 RepID=UPI003CCE1AF5
MDSSPSEPPSKRRKRQQRKACDLCRRRKVRCDIDEIPGGAGPCSVCNRSGLQCRSTTQWVKPNRPATNARWQSQDSQEYQIRRPHTPPVDSQNPQVAPEDLAGARVQAAQSEGAEPKAGNASPSSTRSRVSHSSHKEEFARSGLSRFFKHGINAAAWGVFDPLKYMRIAYVGTAVSNLVHLVQLHRASRPGLTSTAVNSDSAGLEDVSIQSDNDTTRSPVHYPYPPIRPKNGWKPGLEVWNGMLTADITADVSSFPAREVRDALITAYFEHVHPFHPVISMPEFMESYRSPDKPPPLLLFQAVLMAGAHACEHPLVASARHAVKTTLFRRASMLFHMRHETDRVFLMQAAVLFTRHVGDGDTVTGGPWYWSGNAVRIGCGLGMHRYSPSLPPRESSQYRRCWWSAFVCEVFVALETGRPCAVRAEDLDQLNLTAEDMTDGPGITPMNEGGLDHGFLFRMVELAYIGLDILAINEPAQKRIIDVQGINTRLCQWSLQCKSPTGGKEDTWEYQLQLHYSLLLLHLHRNFPADTNSQSISSTAAQSTIRIFETLISLNCLSQCHFTAVSALTAAGTQLANEIRSTIETQSFLLAANSLGYLLRLLRPANLLAQYWSNAEAVHNVFQEIHQEYQSLLEQGLQAFLLLETGSTWERIGSGCYNQASQEVYRRIGALRSLTSSESEVKGLSEYDKISFPVNDT